MTARAGKGTPGTDGHASRFYAAVRKIRKGTVAAYGEVARMAGLPGRARQVGYALHRLPWDTTVPWHRVVNAKGEIAIGADPDAKREQRRRLEAEGVGFDAHGRVARTHFMTGTRPR